MIRSVEWSAIAGLTLPGILLWSCAPQAGKADDSKAETYVLEADRPVRIVLDPQNKGLGSDPPQRLGVAFTLDELKRFYAPSPLPISPALARALAEEEVQMHRAGECSAYAGDSPVSMILRPSRDHTVADLVRNTRRTATYEFADKPRQTFGLLNYGSADFSGTGEYILTDELRLPVDGKFGFKMDCGHLDTEAEGGCVVSRDLHKNLYASYSFCERLLPYWQELDSLYFDIADRIVKDPALDRSYRVRNVGG